MSRTRSPQSPRSHVSGFIASFVLLCAILMLGTRQKYLRATISNDVQVTNVGVEHDGPAALTWEMGIGGRAMLIDVRHTGSGALGLNLPQSWHLREVRGAELASITSDPVADGYVRWMLPGMVTASFEASSITSITFHNAATTPLSVTYTRVDLATGARDEGVLLVLERPTALP